MARMPHHTPEWRDPAAGDPGTAGPSIPKPSAPSPVPIPYPIVVKPSGRDKAFGDDDDKWIDILSMGPPITGPHSAQMPGMRHSANLTLKRGSMLVPGERYQMLKLRDIWGRKLELTGVQIVRVREFDTDAGQEEFQLVYETIQRVR